MTTRESFEITPHGGTVPTLTAAEAAHAAALARQRYGVQPVQIAENLGRSVADLSVGLGATGSAAGLRVLVLVGAHFGGLGAAVAARHLVNRGGRVTVLFERRVPELPQLHAQLGSMLAVLGIELQIAETGDVGLYVPENAPYDRIVDGLGGHDAPSELSAVSAALVAAVGRARTAVIAVECPSGLDPTTGTARNASLQATATLAAGFPLAAAAANPEAFGELFLADLSYPCDLASELGLSLAPIFAHGPMLRLSHCG